MNSIVEWKEGMQFEVQIDGFNFSIDADEKAGGKKTGPRPKGLVLSALAGCTAMDVISILEQKKIKPEKFSVTARAKVDSNHPRVFTAITVSYNFEGKDLDIEKIKAAVELSDTLYCGVTAMLRKNCEVNNEIIVNEQVV